MKCVRCKKEKPPGDFAPTRRGNISKRCRTCLEYVRRDTTCKRCLKTFPLEEFAPSRHGGRITYCTRCALIRVKAHHLHAAKIQEANKVLATKGEKTCPRCRATKTLDLFRDDRGYIRRVCVPCRKYMMEHTQKQRAKWTPERRARANEISSNSRKALRREVIAAYGDHCRCCGESTFEFLAIDHIAGDGRSHRKSLRESAGGGEIPAYEFYNWLKNGGYPEGFQILCHNCNVAKGLYGTCPHRKNPLLLVETAGLGPMVVVSAGHRSSQ